MKSFLFSIAVSLIFAFVPCEGKKQGTEQSTKAADSVPVSKKNVNEINIDSVDLTFITDEEIKKVKPAINKWLAYYNLNIKDFVFDKEKVLNLNELRNETTYPYYGEFQKEDDIYDPVLYDYSPDKSKYIDLLAATGVYVENEKYYFRGSDDCQQLGLYDRKEKSYVMFSFRAMHEFADAIFWINNNTFALVGYNTIDYPTGWYTLEIYDLKNDICRSYILREKYDKKESYGIAGMKARGIKIE